MAPILYAGPSRCLSGLAGSGKGPSWNGSRLPPGNTWAEAYDVDVLTRCSSRISLEGDSRRTDELGLGSGTSRGELFASALCEPIDTDVECLERCTNDECGKGRRSVDNVSQGSKELRQAKRPGTARSRQRIGGQLGAFSAQVKSNRVNRSHLPGGLTLGGGDGRTSKPRLPCSDDGVKGIKTGLERSSDPLAARSVLRGHFGSPEEGLSSLSLSRFLAASNTN